MSPNSGTAQEREIALAAMGLTSAKRHHMSARNISAKHHRSFTNSNMSVRKTSFEHGPSPVNTSTKNLPLQTNTSTKHHPSPTNMLDHHHLQFIFLKKIKDSGYGGEFIPGGL